MGKLLKIVNNIQQMSDTKLVSRLEKLSEARAVREYTSTKKDQKLITELNLVREEVLKRISICKIAVAVEID